MRPYILPKRVRNYTGVKPQQIDFEDDAELDAEITLWIKMAQEMVENEVEVRWDPDQVEAEEGLIRTEVPEGVKMAVLRIVANIIAQARVRRQSGTLNLDEFRQILIPDQVFTQSIKDDLQTYMLGGKIYQEAARDQQTEEGKKFGFSMFRVRSPRQLEESAAWYPTQDRRR